MYNLYKLVITIMIPVITIPWIEGEEEKGEGGGGEFKYHIINTL
jgi:hypothetical protein